jgi:hypothetical protein
MVTTDGGDAKLARAGRLGRRAGFAVVLVVSVLFVASSTWQITRGVFGLGTTPLPSGPPQSPERACAIGIERLARDPGAYAPAAGGRGGASAASGARDAWADSESVGRACAATRDGLDAWAALLRLRAARAQLDRNDRDLELLRVEVREHLPADLR